MSNLKKIIGIHNFLRDRIWAFATKPNPPAEKMLDYLPRTDRTKAIHWIDDQWTDFKNRLQQIERKFLAFLFWLFIAAVVLYLFSLAFSTVARIF